MRVAREVATGVVVTGTVVGGGVASAKKIINLLIINYHNNDITSLYYVMKQCLFCHVYLELPFQCSLCAYVYSCTLAVMCA